MTGKPIQGMEPVRYNTLHVLTSKFFYDIYCQFFEAIASRHMLFPLVVIVFVATSAVAAPATGSLTSEWAMALRLLFAERDGQHSSTMTFAEGDIVPAAADGALPAMRLVKRFTSADVREDAESRARQRGRRRNFLDRSLSDFFGKRKAEYYKWFDLQTALFAPVSGDGPAYFVARGSEIGLTTGALKDWITNFRLSTESPAQWRRPSVKVSAGIFKGWTQLRPHVLTAIQNLGVNRVVFGGTSQGGTLATVSAVDIAVSLPMVNVDLFTAGAPAVGNNAFAHFASDKLKQIVQFVMRTNCDGQLYDDVVTSAINGRFGYTVIARGRTYIDCPLSCMDEGEPAALAHGRSEPLWKRAARVGLTPLLDRVGITRTVLACHLEYQGPTANALGFDEAITTFKPVAK